VTLLGLIWVLPILPALGFALNGLLGARLLPKKAIAGIACGAVLLAFLLSLGAVLSLGGVAGLSSVPGLTVDAHAHRVTRTLYAWMPMGRTDGGQELTVDWAYLLDPLSAVMLLVVTGVGFLIHVYSIGYMEHEPQAAYARFFSYLNLFMAMMLTLVLGASLPVVFVGWEGVGLCSYLLIGFYYDRVFDEKSGMTCADAGRKAFLVNRIGDVGFVLGMLVLFAATGTLDIQGILGKVGGLGAGVCTLAALFLFVGACGKSAQIPLYVWLPDAMAGPTPVSALIHAATMVTAGVYVTCRMAPLYMMSPRAMLVVALVGGFTALFAAVIGVAQNDIKKVLAYSTVSQLGYMMLAAGVGAFSASVFHLMTHAFFKALLFLGAGSVIHAMSGEQDIRKMGGLERFIPWTHGTFLVATLAIAGIVPFSGFFSKDEILWAAWQRSPLLWVVGVGTAGLTAFYMARLYTLVFLGKGRFDEETRHHLHESPRTMTVPLVVLAVLSAVGGFVGIPEVLHLPNVLGGYLAPVFGAGGDTAHAPGLEILLMLASLAVASFSLAFGWACYARWPEIPERFADRARGLYRLIVNKYYVDELYDRIVLRPYAALCRGAAWFDQWIVDGLVNAAAYITLGVSYTSVGFDTYVVDGLVNLAGYTVRGVSWMLKKLQTGVVQSYATIMILGIFILVSVYVLSTSH
jgi:NADH-quinone oxidoreductase subunit L